MPYVKVKTKGQVTIPAEFRRDLNLNEGDLLEAVVERGGLSSNRKPWLIGTTRNGLKTSSKKPQRKANALPRPRKKKMLKKDASWL